MDLFVNPNVIFIDMKRILVFFYCICIAFISLAQDVDAAINDFIRYRDSGQFEKAIEIGFKILPQLASEENQEFNATLLEEIAGCYRNLGNLNKAIELESQTLDIRKRVLGEQHPDYANSLAYLAYY